MHFSLIIAFGIYFKLKEDCGFRPLSLAIGSMLEGQSLHGQKEQQQAKTVPMSLFMNIVLRQVRSSSGCLADFRLQDKITKCTITLQRLRAFEKKE